MDADVYKKVVPTSESLAERMVYGTDASCIEGNAAAVVWPSDYEQIKQVIRLASREDLPIVARGGGTSLVGGAVSKNALVMDMARLNKIRKLFVGEKMAIVQSGVILDQLNSALAEFNLEFPVIPSSHAACTIGGMIATNALGKIPSREGWMKEWVKDLTFIDGTGKVFTIDGNEARRFMDTEGCCGIIIEATLRLMNKHNYTTDLFKFSDIPSLMAKVKELADSKDTAAVEFISRHAAKILGLGSSDMLLVRYYSNKGAIDHEEAEKLWQTYDNIYSLIVNAGYPKAEDPLFDKDVDKFLDWLDKQEIPSHGRIAVGSVQPYLRSAADEEKMILAVNELKGRVAGAHGLGLLRKKYANLGVSQNMKEFKLKYDPKNLLNKGKVV